MLYQNVKDDLMNHKGKFDYNKYVKKFYMDNGIAYISCNANSINDIISHYSVKDYEWLNKDFINYIESNVNYIPSKYPITVEICGGYFNDDEKKVIVETIKDYFNLRLGDKQIDLKVNTKKSLFMLSLGILSFIISYLFIHYNIIQTFSEWFLIVFWFFVWEFCEVSILERNDLKIALKDAKQLANINVIFSDIEKISK